MEDAIQTTNGKLATAYFGVAFVSSVQENYTDAVLFYRAALHYEKKFAPIYHNLAKTLCMQNKTSPPSEVVELLNEAIKRSPDSLDNYQTFFDVGKAKKRLKRSDQEMILVEANKHLINCLLDSEPT